MKSFLAPFPLLVLACCCSANAALVASFHSDDTPPFGSLAPVEPHDYADHLVVSSLLPQGSVTRVNGEFEYRNWDTTMNPDDFIGFSVTVESGYQMTLTDLDFSSVVTAGSVSTFQWGYRVDDGSGFGAWNYGTIYSTGNAGFASDIKEWDFSDVAVTGTVQFALFAQAPNGTSGVFLSQPGGSLTLNGNVAAVPEPSAFLLAALGGLAAFRRRR